MHLPKQSAPVVRHVSPVTMSGENGVAASGTLDDVLKVIATIGGVATPILGSLAPVLGSLI
jgi:choline-glycine betaine transporter